MEVDQQYQQQQQQQEQQVVTGAPIDEPPDCTIACDKGHITVHKLVLCEHSKYLQEILSKYPNAEHPIIILTELNIIDVRILVYFMYTGELVITNDASPTSLLRAAQILKIDSLTADDSNSADDYSPSATTTTTIQNSNNNNSNNLNANTTPTTSLQHLRPNELLENNNLIHNINSRRNNNHHNNNNNNNNHHHRVVHNHNHHHNNHHDDLERDDELDQDQGEDEDDDVDNMIFQTERSSSSISHNNSINNSINDLELDNHRANSRPDPLDLNDSDVGLDAAGAVGRQIAAAMGGGDPLDKNNKIRCHLCNIGLSDVKCLYRHVLTRHLPEKWGYKCEFCDREFSRDDHLMRHYTTKHKNMEFDREKIRETRRLNREMAKNFHDQISTA